MLVVVNIDFFSPDGGVAYDQGTVWCFEDCVKILSLWRCWETPRPSLDFRSSNSTLVSTLMLSLVKCSYEVVQYILRFDVSLCTEGYHNLM